MKETHILQNAILENAFLWKEATKEKLAIVPPSLKPVSATSPTNAQKPSQQGLFSRFFASRSVASKDNTVSLPSDGEESSKTVSSPSTDPESLKISEAYSYLQDLLNVDFDREIAILSQTIHCLEDAPTNAGTPQDAYPINSLMSWLIRQIAFMHPTVPDNAMLDCTNYIHGQQGKPIGSLEQFTHFTTEQLQAVINSAFPETSRTLILDKKDFTGNLHHAAQTLLEHMKSPAQKHTSLLALKERKALVEAIKKQHEAPATVQSLEHLPPHHASSLKQITTYFRHDRLKIALLFYYLSPSNALEFLSKHQVAINTLPNRRDPEKRKSILEGLIRDFAKPTKLRLETADTSFMHALPTTNSTQETADSILDFFMSPFKKLRENIALTSDNMKAESSPLDSNEAVDLPANPLKKDTLKKAQPVGTIRKWKLIFSPSTEEAATITPTQEAITGNEEIALPRLSDEKSSNEGTLNKLRRTLSFIPQSKSSAQSHTQPPAWNSKEIGTALLFFHGQKLTKTTADPADIEKDFLSKNDNAHITRIFCQYSQLKQFLAFNNQKLKSVNGKNLEQFSGRTLYTQVDNLSAEGLFAKSDICEVVFPANTPVRTLLSLQARWLSEMYSTSHPDKAFAWRVVATLAEMDPHLKAMVTLGEPLNKFEEIKVQLAETGSKVKKISQGQEKIRSKFAAVAVLAETKYGLEAILAKPTDIASKLEEISQLQEKIRSRSMVKRIDPAMCTVVLAETKSELEAIQSTNTASQLEHLSQLQENVHSKFASTRKNALAEIQSELEEILSKLTDIDVKLEDINSKFTDLDINLQDLAAPFAHIPPMLKGLKSALAESKSLFEGAKPTFKNARSELIESTRALQTLSKLIEAKSKDDKIPSGLDTLQLSLTEITGTFENISSALQNIETALAKTKPHTGKITSELSRIQWANAPIHIHPKRIEATILSLQEAASSVSNRTQLEKIEENALVAQNLAVTIINQPVSPTLQDDLANADFASLSKAPLKLLPTKSQTRTLKGSTKIEPASDDGKDVSTTYFLGGMPSITPKKLAQSQIALKETLKNTSPPSTEEQPPLPTAPARTDTSYYKQQVLEAALGNTFDPYYRHLPKTHDFFKDVSKKQAKFDKKAQALTSPEGEYDGWGLGGDNATVTINGKEYQAYRIDVLMHNSVLYNQLSRDTLAPDEAYYVIGYKHSQAKDAPIHYFTDPTRGAASTIVSETRFSSVADFSLEIIRLSNKTAEAVPMTLSVQRQKRHAYNSRYYCEQVYDIIDPLKAESKALMDKANSKAEALPAELSILSTSHTEIELSKAKPLPQVTEFVKRHAIQQKRIAPKDISPAGIVEIKSNITPSM